MILSRLDSYVVNICLYQGWRTFAITLDSRLVAVTEKLFRLLVEISNELFIIYIIYIPLNEYSDNVYSFRSIILILNYNPESILNLALAFKVHFWVLNMKDR